MVVTIINCLLQIIAKKRKYDSISTATLIGVIIGSVVAILATVYLELFFYKTVVLGAMGAHLNPVGFWDMFGFDLFVGMLTTHTSSKE